MTTLVIFISALQHSRHDRARSRTPTSNSFLALHGPQENTPIPNLPTPSPASTLPSTALRSYTPVCKRNFWRSKDLGHRPSPDLCSGPFCSLRVATEPQALRGSLEESGGGWSQARSLCGFITVDQDVCHPSSAIRIFLHFSGFPKSLVAQEGTPHPTEWSALPDSVCSVTLPLLNGDTPN